MATIDELIPLLDFPTFLQEKIVELKRNNANSDEVDGFIVLYDYYKGDCSQIKTYLQDSKNKITQKTHKKSSFSWMKYAAIFFVILGIGTYISLQKTTTNFYKTYADKDLGLPVFMSIEKNALDNWMLEYKDEKYVKALKTGMQLLRANPKNDTICYYLGVIQLELNHPVQAARYFSKINTKKSVFAEQSYWLTAICWMYTDKPKAKKMLENISQSASFYNGKAKVLLEEEF
jgi:hypothetical protein